MAIKIVPSNARGYRDHGWLKSHHTFSFADYLDRTMMGFSVLRVVNDDRVAGGMGFATHGHKNMEIVTYIIDGALTHRDSMGNSTVIRPGEVQRMSAGTGIQHSEFNYQLESETRLLQIWIQPAVEDVVPNYGQKDFSEELAKSDLVLVVSPGGTNGSISINQDAKIFALKSLTAGQHTFASDARRKYWVQSVCGELTVSGTSGRQILRPGDAAAIDQEPSLSLAWIQGSEFLLFDLPVT